MKVTLTRDCIIGPSEVKGQLNSGKAGQTVDVREADARLLIVTGCATEPTKQTQK